MEDAERGLQLTRRQLQLNKVIKPDSNKEQRIVDVERYKTFTIKKKRRVSPEETPTAKRGRFFGKMRTVADPDQFSIEKKKRMRNKRRLFIKSKYKTFLDMS